MKIVLEKSNYKDIESVVFSNGHFSLYFSQSSRIIEFPCPPAEVPFIDMMHNERGSKDIWDCDYKTFYSNPALLLLMVLMWQDYMMLNVCLKQTRNFPSI